MPINTHLVQPGFRAKYFLTSTCKAASSPLWIEPILQELAKFDAGKQSSATLSQHLRLMSNRKAWRVAKTTRGEPDFDSLANITLIVPEKENIKNHRNQSSCRQKLTDCNNCSYKYDALTILYQLISKWVKLQATVGKQLSFLRWSFGIQ